MSAHERAPRSQPPADGSECIRAARCKRQREMPQQPRLRNVSRASGTFPYCAGAPILCADARISRGEGGREGGRGRERESEGGGALPARSAILYCARGPPPPNTHTL